MPLLAYARTPMIYGPTEAEVGEPVKFIVRGLPKLDVDAPVPLRQQLEWMGKATPYALPLSAATLQSRWYFVPTEAKKTVVDEVKVAIDNAADDEAEVAAQLAAAIATVIASQEQPDAIEFVWELEVIFSEACKGSVLLDWNLGEGNLHIHEILVGPAPPDPEPDPEPDPDPDPEPDPMPPDPDRKWQITIFHQSSDLDNMDIDQRELISGLRWREEFEEDGHNFVGGYNVDSVVECEARGGSCPYPWSANVMPFWRTARGTDTPSISIAPNDGDGGEVITRPLPNSVDGLYELLEGLP
jgi:hypothetical protein